ncbi:regulation of nuclear pre-mRNA domain-containing protein 2-like [Saccostrea cucullata]|uniref:regulation of nuclear pre-mRNA domain-containing protein 2-like n=1 Tax=Saccostrea cuccullata TaxID=36930 RepID=UPI002ECFADB9
MDKRLIFVACCLSAVYAVFPPTCELECVAGYIGDIAECRVDFPYKPAGPNKDLQLCLLEVESDRNICMVMNRDPACVAKAATSTMHLPFKMNLTKPPTTTPAPTTTTTTTTTPPPKPSTAPLQVGPALSQPSRSGNHLIQLYVDPRQHQQTMQSPYGLVGRPNQGHYSPVAVEPQQPMPSGLTVAQARRHQQIQNMIQRSAPQASVSQRPVPQVRSSIQLPARPMPKQMQLPSQSPPKRTHLPQRTGPQPRVVPQQQQQSYSVARTNPKIIQRRLTVYKLAKPFKPNSFSSPQQSFSAGNLFRV